MKMPNVTEGGELVETEFDVSTLDDDDDSDVDDRDYDEDGNTRAGNVRSTGFEKEMMTRATKIQDMHSVNTETLKNLSQEVALLKQQNEQMQMLLKELLRRIPAVQAQGEITYVYATAKTVGQIRQLKGLNMCHFALALETEVYSDDTTELELLVDKRTRTKDRMLFIQQCVYKFYEIPAHLRDGTWKKVKEALNSRVRRLRKTLRDRNSQRSQSGRGPGAGTGSENCPPGRMYTDAYFFDEE